MRQAIATDIEAQNLLRNISFQEGTNGAHVRYGTTLDTGLLSFIRMLDGVADWSWWTVDRVSALGQVLGALFAGGAALFAGLAFRKQRQQLARLEAAQDRHDAERVGAWITWKWEVEHAGPFQEAGVEAPPGNYVCVRNGGNSPIFDCAARVVLSPRDESTGKEDDCEFVTDLRFGTIPAGDSPRRYVPATNRDVHERLLVSITFRDGGGRTWTRDAEGVLRALRTTGFSS